jgi:hypothetical protein
MKGEATANYLAGSFKTVSFVLMFVMINVTKTPINVLFLRAIVAKKRHEQSQHSNSVFLGFRLRFQLVFSAFHQCVGVMAWRMFSWTLKKL